MLRERAAHQLHDDLVNGVVKPGFDNAIKSFIEMSAELSPDEADLNTLTNVWVACLDAHGIPALGRAYIRTVETATDEVSTDGWSDDPEYLPPLTAAADYSQGAYSFWRFLRNAWDRLVYGLKPPLPEEAFELIKAAVVSGATLGESDKWVRERIAVELGWSKNLPYWDEQTELVDAALDELLDQYGPPGTPAREAVRLTDPRVAALQNEKAAITLAKNRESTTWQVRAQMIARTETTYALNDANMLALHAEGWTHKEWSADRTARPSHRDARGQTVPIGENFIVGGYALSMPGDPTAPAGEVVNCRCIALGSEGIGFER